MKLLAADIFSGAGGLAAGISLSGFKPKFACDLDEKSCSTLSANKSFIYKQAKETLIQNEDAKLIDFSELKDKIDLLSGGPPCQPFSKAGKHNSHTDSRDLFPEAIRAVREIRPAAYLFENVSGIRRKNFSQYFEYLRLQLTHPEIQLAFEEKWQDHLLRLEEHHVSGSRSGLNYRLIVHQVNAADYGVPQQRNRIFFVGFREDVGADWHFPKVTHSKQALALEMLSGRYWERNKIPKADRLVPKTFSTDQPSLASVNTRPWITLREAICDLPCPNQVIQDEYNQDVLHIFRPGAKAYKGHTGSRLDQPAKTLKAGVHGVPGGENMFVNDRGELRYFTLRECARIQTFPDSYKFVGSWSSVLKQLGNAVPVELSRVIGASINAALLSAKQGSTK